MWGGYMTEYQHERKLLRDYLSKQRRSGLTIQTKLPKMVKNPTEKSIEELKRRREKAKQQAAKARITLKKKEAQSRAKFQEFQKTPLRKIHENAVSKKSTPVQDLTTGEIVREEETRQPGEDFDSYDNAIKINVYDWANDGAQTEYSERILMFINDCVAEYGSRIVAEALQVARNRNIVLTKLEKYNDVYCHAWITLFQDILTEISHKFPNDISEKYDKLMYDANEDQFNGELDAELYQSRYSGNG